MSSLCLSNVCPSPPSIRRTFSAEILPQTNQNGFLSFKKAQDDDQINTMMKNSSCSNGDDREKKGAFDEIWSSIQKNVGSGTTDLSPPYVHPLVKRTTSLLTQKSLEVCTESLGSETGSDTGLEQVQPNGTAVDVEEIVASWCTKLPSSRIPEVVPTSIDIIHPSSFPPPLPSLSHREGSNLHMRAHRKDGRLVVEAVAVPSVKSLCAHRHHGRLLLTLNKNTDEETTMLKDEKELGSTVVVIEEKTRSYSAPSTLIMSKLTELTNCRWPRNMNATIVRRPEDSDAFNNAYECYWKNVGPLLMGPQQNKKVGPLLRVEDAHNKGKLARGGAIGNYNITTNNNKREKKAEKEEEYENIMGGCKRRSSLLFWDSDKHPTSFYIATS